MSPWQQGFGYEDVQNANFKRYMKGVQKVEQVRSNISKLQHQRQVYSNRTRYQHQQQQQQQQQQSKFTSNQQPLQHNSYYSQPTHQASSPVATFQNKQDIYNSKNLWLGKGRGNQQLNQIPPSNTYTSLSGSKSYRPQHYHSYGRGQWMNTSIE